jgi:hypothetical protein
MSHCEREEEEEEFIQNQEAEEDGQEGHLIIPMR